MRGIAFRRLLMAALMITAAAGRRAEATELHVIVANSARAALLRLAPDYMRQSGDRIDIEAGLSGGGGANAIPARLAHGMVADVLVILRPDLDRLVRRGLVLQGATADVARARVATLVRTDAPAADLGSPAGLRRALLAAPSIAIPGGGSGAFVSRTLFRRLGVQDAIAGRTHEVQGMPVARAIADGQAAIGFQQASEVGDVQGVRIVPLPPALQMPDAIAAGIAGASRHRDASARLIRYLSSMPAQAVIAASGLARVRP
ncbi:substrate-binding domain-containing protein [Lichenicoccus sp.]|uniref:substrate-binding domain-containing protein n=1 Tax=Lichenicoccus sp. TaxID=2781899 RepID=UPI003D1237A3